MKTYRIALIPGDGVGPEVVEAAWDVASQAAGRFGFALDGVRFPWSCDYYLEHGVMMPAASNGQFVESFPDGKVFNFCDIIDRQLQVRDGGLVLPSEPGLGYLFDEKAIARFQADGWK